MKPTLRSFILAVSCLRVGPVGCDAARSPGSRVEPVPVRTPTAHPLALDVAYGPVDPATPIPVRREGAYANLDPDDDLVVGAPDEVADCEEQLVRAGVRHRP